ncbi:hypothetical protein [Brevundimonas sp.]|uniref:hypothetical protein n=1 Tax=Brevundimonas sp. TaxID=1871086 RepID=UPI002ED9B1DA
MRLIPVSMIVTGLAGCASVPPIAPGDYCLVEPLVADTGRETFALGDFSMRARVAARNGQTLISFTNAMPDSQEILHVEDEPARMGRDGTLRFTFVDGWGNAGQGALTPGGVMTLDLISRSSDPLGANIGRNYGTFRLTADDCDREPRPRPSR